ncbi:MarR family winged helix-turn-helix transcriptional regulator [Streptomyces sp. NPDC054775]
MGTREFLALTVLRQHGESTSVQHWLYEVAAEVGLSQSATSRLVTRLHERGLLMRRTSDHDRRSADVQLTAAALDLLQRCTPVFEEALSERARQRGTPQRASGCCSTSRGEPVGHEPGVLAGRVGAPDLKAGNRAREPRITGAASEL